MKRADWGATVLAVTFSFCAGVGVVHFTDVRQCREAIQGADTLIASSGQAMVLSSDALTAVSEFDLDAIGDVEDEMDTLTPLMQSQADTYVEQKERCRS